MNHPKLYVRGYNGQGFGSGFIRWFTFGKYSHVSLRFDMGDYEEEIEAIQGRGVVRHAPYTHDEKDFEEMVVPISDTQSIEAHIIAASLVGSKYDWKGIYGFVVRKKRHSPEKWSCQEIVAYVLLKVGYPLSRREPYRETPTSIMESFRIHPDSVSIKPR